MRYLAHKPGTTGNKNGFPIVKVCDRAMARHHWPIGVKGGHGGDAGRLGTAAAAGWKLLDHHIEDWINLGTGHSRFMWRCSH